MIQIYRSITSLIFAFLYLYGIGRAGKGCLLWRGRLGLIDESSKADIWLHAASVGEVKIIGYLINFLLERRPSLKIHLTAMTRAGYRTANDLFGDKVSITYYPYDAGPAVRRTLERIAPRLIVLAETEIWPNLIMEASKRKIGLILVNGRMSEKAFGQYKFIRLSLGKLLRRYEHFFFKTESDAARYDYFLSEGSIKTQPAKTIAGDMKFDAPLSPRIESRIAEVRRSLGVEDGQVLFVAGSTRTGEETLLLERFSRMPEPLSRLRMVIAPRHVERSDEVIKEIRRHNLPYSVYGRGGKPERLTIVDQMGVLPDLFAAADLAFVGGTLTPLGGHNLLEPVWSGTPVLFGSSIFNVKEAADYITSRRYGEKCFSAAEMWGMIEQFCSGEIAFEIKTKHDQEDSPTVCAGEHILKRLQDV